MPKKLINVLAVLAVLSFATASLTFIMGVANSQTTNNSEICAGPQCYVGTVTLQSNAVTANTTVSSTPATEDSSSGSDSSPTTVSSSVFGGGPGPGQPPSAPACTLDSDCGGLLTSGTDACCNGVQCYDDKTEGCCDGSVYTLNNALQYQCCKGKVFEAPKNSGINLQCCGSQGFDDNKQTCCNGTDVIVQGYNQLCCGTVPYNPDLQICCAWDGKSQLYPGAGNKNLYCCGINLYTEPRSCCYDDKDSAQLCNGNQACCDGTCTNINTDPNCGKCGVNCSANCQQCVLNKGTNLSYQCSGGCFPPKVCDNGQCSIIGPPAPVSPPSSPLGGSGSGSDDGCPDGEQYCNTTTGGYCAVTCGVTDQ